MVQKRTFWLMEQAEIRIRTFQVEDGPQIASIWEKGLKQTVESCEWSSSKYIFDKLMYKLAEKSLSESGDIGPGGKNLASHWLSEPDHRCMLVAVSESKVVGCCGVTRGTSEQWSFTCSNSTEFSVWRVSISENYRRRGVGTKFMEAAEKFAVEHGGKKMLLVTGNRFASAFYQKIGYTVRWYGWSPWHEKILI